MITVTDRIDLGNYEYINLDARYTDPNGNPFSSVSAAQTYHAGKMNELFIGLTVLVKESGWTEAKEYWVQPKGTTPETYGLVEKGAGTTDYNDLDNKPTISDGGQGSAQIPLSGNVKVTATAATSGQTTGVAVTAENGGIKMAFTLEKGAKGDTGGTGLTGPQGIQGKSAFEVWKETTGRANATEAEYIEDLQTKVVRWIPVAYEATAASATIGDTVTFTSEPSNSIDGAIVLMPNGSPATATMMFAVSEDTNTPGTYIYTYIGELTVDTTGLLGSGDVDGTGLKNPTSSQIAKATDVMKLAAKLEGVDLSVESVSIVTSGSGQNAFSGKYINGLNGTVQSGNANNYVVLVPVEGYDRVSWLAKESSVNGSNVGFVFGKFTGVVNDSLTGFVAIESGIYSIDSVGNKAVEYTRDVPAGATYLAATVWGYSSIGDSSVTINNFYVKRKIGVPTRSIELGTVRYAPASGEMIDFNINSSGNWVSGPNNLRGIVTPINEGDVIEFVGRVSNLSITMYVAFLSDYTGAVNGESANVIAGVQVADNERKVLVVPSGAKYLYYDRSKNSYSCFLRDISVKTKGAAMVPWKIRGLGDYDTWVEENYVNVVRQVNNNSVTYIYKTYKLDKTSRYKGIINIQGTQQASIRFYNYYFSEITGADVDNWSGTGTAEFRVMQDVDVPAGAYYATVVFKCTPGSLTDAGCGALMRPLKNDGWEPTNKNIYCVSKIKRPALPYNYDADGVAYEQTEVWSAWSFMMPTSYRGGAGKPYPIVSFFHGSSGFLTSECMGYNAANTRTGIVAKLLDKGFIVFDINGRGVSYENDDFSRHWGCPDAVATVKKAYTVLTERFNGRRGMVISGISMGGAIAKSYCMTYPQDVVAAALEAPSEVGCTMRTSGLDSSTPFVKSWNAWDADNGRLDKNVFMGYSPLVNPQEIATDTGAGRAVLYRDIDSWTLSDWIMTSVNAGGTHLATDKQLYGRFPVEVVIWHGDADINVDLGYSQQFVRTIRNAGCNGKLRICPGCAHSLNTYPWVMAEVVEYITNKLGC